MTNHTDRATDSPERNRIGERLKRARGSVSQGDYAKRFGVTTTTLGRYERGERTPDVDFISTICKETGVNPRWLILGDEPMYDAEASQERPRLKVKDLVGREENELPMDVQRAIKKTRKAMQTLGQEWERLPEWAKEEFDELYEQVDALIKERDEARVAELKAKDEAIKTQGVALQMMQTVAAKGNYKLSMAVLEDLRQQGGYENIPTMLRALSKLFPASPSDIDDEPETTVAQHGLPQSDRKNDIKK